MQPCLSHPRSFPTGHKVSPCAPIQAHPPRSVNYILDSSNFLALSKTAPLGSEGLRGHFHEDMVDIVSSQAYPFLIGNNAALNQR